MKLSPTNSCMGSKSQAMCECKYEMELHMALQCEMQYWSKIYIQFDYQNPIS